MVELTRKPASANNGGELDNDNAQEVAGDKTFKGDVVHEGDVEVQGAFSAVNSINGQRNWMINGNFDFWQRSGAGAVGVGTTSVYVADRWRFSRGGSGTVQVQRSDVSPNDESKHSVLITGDTGTQYVIMSQRIEASEAKQLINETSLWISFWFYNGTGADCTPRVRIFTPTAEDDWSAWTSVGAGTQGTQVCPAGQWTKVYNWRDLTYNMVDLDKGFQVQIRLDTPGTMLDDSGKHVRVAQVMVNRGPAIAPFQRAGESIGAELALCQRYYEKTYRLDTVPGSASTPGAAGARHLVGANRLYMLNTTYKVTKRTTPSVSLWDVGGVSGQYKEYNSAGTLTHSSFVDKSVNEVGSYSNVTSGPGTGHYLFHWVAEAEL